MRVIEDGNMNAKVRVREMKKVVGISGLPDVNGNEET